MRSSLAWLRETYAASEGPVAPAYGLVTAVGVSGPLIVGVLSGRTGESVLVGLGAFYVAFAGPTGPYGARARSMLAATAVVTVFTWFGGLLSGDPWLATAVVPLVAALGAAIPWMGPTAALVTLIAAVRPPGSPVIFDGVLEMIGGLWMTALLLAPWITRRLRPLHLSVAEAANAVADALDAPPGAWDHRRREAYDALRRARATYALYRGGGPDGCRPRSLGETLDQAMDETVALRSLLRDLGEENPPERWERERRTVVGALAVRLRALAAELERGEAPPGPVALDRFVRVSDEARQEWVEGGGDVVGTALILQIRRIVGRIAATVDRAAEIVAGGLDVGFDVPLPERPAGGWSRVREAVRTRSPGLRHAARAGTAIGAAMALADGLHLPHGHWLPITVMFCLRDSYGDTVERVAKRIGGATVGATVAALALAVAPGRTTLIVLVFAGAVLGFALASVNHTYWVTFGTPITMLLIDFTEPLGWRAAGWRIALTAAGGVVALVAARLLWPAGTLRLLPDRLARLLHTHAELARAVAALFDGVPGTQAHRREREAAQAAVDIDAALQRLAQEPSPPQDLVRRLREATTTAQRLRDYLGTLATLDHEEPVDAGPIPAILERVADHLDGHDLELQDLLRELDDHLGELCRRRRGELAGGAGPVSPLRDALVEVAGARHAVRALAHDAARLTEEGRALRV
ncbi:FUSC family protein [Actinomadura sp. DC4]|uniref:FUSC family protein n=1 Tax=Actinomadura sp. DC4 TaxID=3055069 RepID=UPI0025B1B700|nr:FUSC family protein [Actinomadura sp. DC4]MDN3354561.1 FUSC family protein [Actinomadura sp. DC4]